MARLITAGAEAADLTLEGLTQGGATTTFDTVVKRSGERSYKTDTGIGTDSYCVLAMTGAHGTTYSARIAVRYSQFGGGGAVIRMVGATTSVVFDIQVDLNGVVSIWESTNGTRITGPTLVTGQWYVLELAGRTSATAGQAYFEGRVDGVSFGSSSTRTLSSTFTACRFGITGAGSNVILNWDDIALNDSTGTAQNTWPGDGKVVLLRPTADPALIGNWKTGNGGLTNLWDAVNNTPPTGVAAASETATTNIENTVSGTTGGDYDPTMATYAAAGVGASDTVNLVQPVVAHGEDIATGTKTGSFTIVSNPALGATDTFTFGADVGAHGTWPTNWRVNRGTIQYAPTVTVATAPIMRVSKTDTTSRMGCVCFMGILVDYSPPAGTSATATPAVVANPVSLPAATRVAGSTPAPTALAATTALPAASAVAAVNATASPAAIAVATALPTPTLRGAATPTPAAVAVVTALPVATRVATATPTPAAAAATTALPAASKAATAASAPATIPTNSTLPASAQAAGSTPLPTTVAASTTMPVPTRLAGSTPTPAPIATPASLPSAPISGGARSTPVTVVSTVALQPSAASAGSTSTPIAITASTSLPTAIVQALSTATPVAVAATATVPPSTVTGGGRSTPPALAVVVSLPSSNVQGVGAATSTPQNIAVTTSAPLSTLRSGSTPAPAAVVATVAFPAGTGTSGVHVTPAVLIATTGLPQVTLTTTADALVLPPSFVVGIAFPPLATLASADTMPAVIAALVSLFKPNFPSGRTRNIDFTAGALALKWIFTLTGSSWKAAEAASQWRAGAVASSWDADTVETKWAAGVPVR